MRHVMFCIWFLVALFLVALLLLAGCVSRVFGG